MGGAMKLIIESNYKYSKEYMRNMIFSAVKRVSANPVLLKLVETTGEISYIDQAEEQDVAVLFHGHADSKEAYINHCGSELAVFLPDKDHWHRNDIFSPLGVTDVPDWITFILDTGICNARSEWLVDMAENYMRLDMLAELLNVPVDKLLAMKFVSSDGKEHSAICNRQWERTLTPSSPVDIRAVLAVMVMARFGMKS
jgi:hypothetical protein